MKRLIPSILVALSVLSSCSDDACNDPIAFNYDPEGTTSETCVYQPLEINVKVNPIYNGEALEFGKEYATEDGRSITFDYLGMYLTGFELNVDGTYTKLYDESNDCVTREEDATLWKTDTRAFNSSFMPTESVELSGVRFNLGVDTCRNNLLDPTTKEETSPFAPQSPTMYWSWATGYRFISLEGMVDISANADGSTIQKFEYHVGLNEMLRSVEVSVENWERSGNEMNLDLTFDLNIVLSNVDFTTEYTTHTFNNKELAKKIIDNASNAFSVAK